MTSLPTKQINNASSIYITILSDDLQRQHNDVLHARADADVLIVEKAIACANTKDTVLVGDDIDLLVLLCSHAGPTSHTTCSSDLSLS